METGPTHSTTAPEEYLHEMSQLIQQVYFQMSKIRPSLDVRLLLPAFPSSPSPPPPLPTSQPPSLPALQHSVEVCLSPLSAGEARASLAYQLLLSRLQAGAERELAFEMLNLRSSSSPPGGSGGADESEATDGSISKPLHPSSSLRLFNNVSLGGTFDNLHTGHRLLLTQSALIANRRLLVGVADGPLLKSKVLPELIKPVDVRVTEVKGLLDDVKPSIVHDVVPITDVYGPTAWDESLECLVVTPDTARGGEKVNLERKRKVRVVSFSLSPSPTSSFSFLPPRGLACCPSTPSVWSRLMEGQGRERGREGDGGRS